MPPSVVTVLPLASHLSISVLPLVAVALITTVVAAIALAPRLGTAESVAGLLVFGFGFALSWTLLPDADGLQGLGSDGICNTDRVGLIPWHELDPMARAHHVE